MKWVAEVFIENFRWPVAPRANTRQNKYMNRTVLIRRGWSRHECTSI